MTGVKGLGNDASVDVDVTSMTRNGCYVTSLHVYGVTCLVLLGEDGREGLESQHFRAQPKSPATAKAEG